MLLVDCNNFKFLGLLILDRKHISVVNNKKLLALYIITGEHISFFTAKILLLFNLSRSDLIDASLP